MELQKRAFILELGKVTNTYCIYLNKSHRKTACQIMQICPDKADSNCCEDAVNDFMPFL
jgi:hypothetical protein